MWRCAPSLRPYATHSCFAWVPARAVLARALAAPVPPLSLLRLHARPLPSMVRAFAALQLTPAPHACGASLRLFKIVLRLEDPFLVKNPGFALQRSTFLFHLQVQGSPSMVCPFAGVSVP